jgi:hypothetical protein
MKFHKFRFNRVSIWFYILVLTISLIFIYLTMPKIKPLIEKFKTNRPKKIEDAGFGPFDYGLDSSSVKISPETNDTINYMNQQKKNAESGNVSGNIFDYVK